MGTGRGRRTHRPPLLPQRAGRTPPADTASKGPKSRHHRLRCGGTGGPGWHWRPAPQALPVGSVGGQRRVGQLALEAAEPNSGQSVRLQEPAASAGGRRALQSVSRRRQAEGPWAGGSGDPPGCAADRAPAGEPGAYAEGCGGVASPRSLDLSRFANPRPLQLPKEGPCSAEQSYAAAAPPSFRALSRSSRAPEAGRRRPPRHTAWPPSSGGSGSGPAALGGRPVVTASPEGAFGGLCLAAGKTLAWSDSPMAGKGPRRSPCSHVPPRRGSLERISGDTARIRATPGGLQDAALVSLPVPLAASRLLQKSAGPWQVGAWPWPLCRGSSFTSRDRHGLWRLALGPDGAAWRGHLSPFSPGWGSGGRGWPLRGTCPPKHSGD